MSPRQYELRSKASGNGELPSDLLEISMGPQHPSTHGVFRMDVVLDGERVVKLKPIFGYLHRNHEKIAEGATYLSSIPYTDRLDYFCSLTNNWAYCLAVEKLAGLQVPERAEYIRVITAEFPEFYLLNVYQPNSQRGLTRLDFLRGNEPYKYEWGAVDEPIRRLLVRCEAS